MEMESPKLTPLWKINIMKLESIIPTFRDFDAFFNECQSLNRVGKFVSSEKNEFEHDVKYFKHVSPTLSSYFDVSKNSKLSSMTMEPEEFSHSLEMLNPYFGISDQNIIQKNENDKNSSNSYFSMEKAIEISEEDISRYNTAFLSKSLESSETLSYGDVPRLDILKIHSSVECGESNPPFKEKNNDFESGNVASDWKESSCNCNLWRSQFIKCLTSSFEEQKCNFSGEASFSLTENNQYQTPFDACDFYSNNQMSSKGILPNLGVNRNECYNIEVANDIRVKEYTQARMNYSSENCEAVCSYVYENTDLTDAECLQNQYLFSQNCISENRLVLEKKLRNKICPKSRNDYFEDHTQTSIFGESKLKYEVSKIQNEYSMKSVEGNDYLTDAGINLKLRNESEFREHTKSIQADEVEKNILEREYSKIKRNFVEEARKCDNLDDDSLLKILCSVFDFFCKIDDDASFCKEKPNLIYEPRVEIEEIQSEPFCVKTAKILLYFLDNIIKELRSKKDEASRMKKNFEANVTEYFNMHNSKEGRELAESAKNFVSSCDKVCADLEKDMIECEWYYEILKKIL